MNIQEFVWALGRKDEKDEELCIQFQRGKERKEEEAKKATNWNVKPFQVG